MIRIGIVDLDSSHAPEFTRRINHIDIAEEQWVDGAEVVLAYPGYSPAVADAEEKNATYTQNLLDYGVEMVDSPEDLIGQIDAVMISSDDVKRHHDMAVPFLEQGMPTFIDKPMAFSLDEAAALVALAEMHDAPLCSASSLRYSPEVVEVAEGGAVGEVVGVDAISPSKDAVGGVPGIMYYGIHGVETLFTLMGPGCESVQAITTASGTLTIGNWADGRLGSVRGFAEGVAGFGFRVVGTEGHRALLVGTEYIYRELLKRVIEMFETGEPPFDIRETLEIIAFIEATLKSAETGRRVPVERVD